MRKRRQGNAGVTLIEMLLALAVSSMIGLAGFVLLESTVRTQTGVAGKLDRLERIERTFRLFKNDSSNALVARFRDPQTVEFRRHDFVAVWVVSPSSIQRQLEFRDRKAVTQVLLEESGELEQRHERVVALRLTASDIWRLARLPAATTP